MVRQARRVKRIILSQWLIKYERFDRITGIMWFLCDISSCKLSFRSYKFYLYGNVVDKRGNSLAMPPEPLHEKPASILGNILIPFPEYRAFFPDRWQIWILGQNVIAIFSVEFLVWLTNFLENMIYFPCILHTFTPSL